MRLHVYRFGFCIQLGQRFYPVYPAWTSYAQLSNLNPKMNTKGRIYFEKLPKVVQFPKQQFNPAEGWLDS
jgi:hypothetical protein